MMEDRYYMLAMYARMCCAQEDTHHWHLLLQSCHEKGSLKGLLLFSIIVALLVDLVVLRFG